MTILLQVYTIGQDYVRNIFKCKLEKDVVKLIPNIEVV